jgi:hypothetical protein
MNEIHDIVVEGMTETGINWSSDVQRDSFIDMLDDFMHEVADEGKIEQWDVRCDGRNNKSSDMNDGRFILDVAYKQRHCLNTTVLHYDIEDDGDLTVDFDISF